MGYWGALDRLAKSTQAHAEVAEKASADVTRTAIQLEELLITVADDLSAEVQDKHGQSEKLLDARVASVERELRELQRTHGESVDRKAENALHLPCSIPIYLSNVLRGTQSLRETVGTWGIKAY